MKKMIIPLIIFLIMGCTDPVETDLDSDGYTTEEGDCNDSNSSIHPGATDICDDSIDQDCNGVDEDCRNSDQDSDGYSANAGDCDDTDPNIHPGAVEICGDLIDQDCDGSDLDCGSNIMSGSWTGIAEFGSFDFLVNAEITYISEITFKFASWSCGIVTSSGDISNMSSPGWAIADGQFTITINIDPFNNDEMTIVGTFDENGMTATGSWEANRGSTSCSGTWVAGSSDSDQDSDGYSIGQGDCNDADSGINPGATEICGDMIDQDCDGVDADCGDIDMDSDGFSENEGDCDDTDANIFPGATEVCGDNIDQDCDGVDADCGDIDMDSDGFSENEGDCDDTDANIFPGATEVCGDMIDQDCDGVDVDCGDIDMDSDGFSENEGDCDDTDTNIFPGATEVCGDMIDQDCDGNDEDCVASIKPGVWRGTSEFGTFDITVNPESTFISTIAYSFDSWKCGIVTSSGGLTVSSVSGWAISEGNFEIRNSIDPFGDDRMTISGMFNVSGMEASGTWEANRGATICSGSWEAVPTD